MAADIDYVLIALIVLGAIILIIWLVTRDHKDKKEFENEIIKSELKPEKHDDPEDKNITP